MALASRHTPPANHAPGARDNGATGGRLADVVLCTLGTRGDIEPFVALASMLVERGLAVDLLTNGNWRDLVTPTGATFVEIAPPDPPQSGRDDFGFFRTNTLPSFDLSFDHVTAIAARGARPTLVYRMNMLGVQCAAQRLDLPNIRVALQPSALPSRVRPPWPIMSLVQGWWAPIGRHALVPLAYAMGELFSPYAKHTNGFRKRKGLPRPPLFGSPPRVETVTAVFCPEWFSIPPRDWPDTCRFLGFPFGTTAPVDPASADFLAAGPPPIVFTPGTGVTEVERFTADAIAMARSLNRRAILLSRFIDPASVVGPDVLVRPYVDLGWLLPRCAAIVHHGGIGTVAAAIRAGIPQLVLAGRFDQPDNAVRVAQLGLGGGVLADRPALDDMRRALDAILSADHIAQQVATAAALVRHQDAIAEACRLVLDLRAVPA